MNKTKPKAYRLGEVLFKHLEDDAYYSEEESWYLLESEIIRYGAVPVKSKQIEKLPEFDLDPDSLYTKPHPYDEVPIWHRVKGNRDKINEIIDHLQKE